MAPFPTPTKRAMTLADHFAKSESRANDESICYTTDNAICRLRGDWGITV